VAERTAIVLGASADIGAAHVRRLAADGWSVLGTYRSPGGAADLEDLDGVTLVRCDVASPQDIAALAVRASRLEPWTLVISAVGRLDPVGPGAQAGAVRRRERRGDGRPRGARRDPHRDRAGAGR
jgi:NAD(P)-dependent dehydrogenase (short-subunit alcohol dehydrogenase family)